MTPKEAKHISEVLKAYSEGKIIEYRKKNTITHIIYPWRIYEGQSIDEGYYEYRIKPEPEYRPYKNVEEFFEASKIHGPYIKGPDFDIRGCYHIPNGVHKGGVIWTTYRDLRSNWEELSNCEWQDGTPCGIIENQ